jgi:hypothetical protein
MEVRNHLLCMKEIDLKKVYLNLFKQTPNLIGFNLNKFKDNKFKQNYDEIISNY